MTQDTTYTTQDLINFLLNSRDWHKAIPLLNVIQDHNTQEDFQHWFHHGSTIKLRELTGNIPDNILKELYKDRGQDISDINPYNNDWLAIDTAKGYMQLGLTHVDDPEKHKIMS